MPSQRSSSVCWSRFTSWYSSTVNARNRSRKPSRAWSSSSNSATVRSRRSSKSIRPGGRLAALVLAVHAGHEVYRDGRLVRVERPPVAVRREPAVLRPLDLGREIADRPERYGFGRTRDVASITALDGRIGPAARRSSASWPSAAAWNVCALTPFAPSATSRARISPAALSVNVTARISSAANAPVATWFAMRRVIVVVLPEPAPRGCNGSAHGLDGAALLRIQVGEDARSHPRCHPRRSAGRPATTVGQNRALVARNIAR